MQGPIRSSRPMAGLLLALMLAASVAHGVHPVVPDWIAGLAAWAAAALLAAGLSPGQRRQCAALIGVGLAGVAIGRVDGIQVDYTRLLVENQAILALIAGVSFVHMATSATSVEEDEIPRGHGAFFRTLLGLNVLAAAINITALMLVSDRVSRSRPLRRMEVTAFSRAFSLAVLYSPFIGGMALALNRAPEAGLASVAAVGAVLALCGIGFTYLVARLRDGDSLNDFPGYPLDRKSVV